MVSWGCGVGTVFWDLVCGRALWGVACAFMYLHQDRSWQAQLQAVGLGVFQCPLELLLLCGVLLPYVGVWDQSMVLQDPAKSVDRALCVVGGSPIRTSWGWVTLWVPTRVG